MVLVPWPSGSGHGSAAGAGDLSASRTSLPWTSSSTSHQGESEMEHSRTVSVGPETAARILQAWWRTRSVAVPDEEVISEELSEAEDEDERGEELSFGIQRYEAEVAEPEAEATCVCPSAESSELPTPDMQPGCKALGKSTAELQEDAWKQTRLSALQTKGEEAGDKSEKHRGCACSAALMGVLAFALLGAMTWMSTTKAPAADTAPCLSPAAASGRTVSSNGTLREVFSSDSVHATFEAMRRDIEAARRTASAALQEAMQAQSSWLAETKARREAEQAAIEAQRHLKEFREAMRELTISRNVSEAPPRHRHAGLLRSSHSRGSRLRWYDEDTFGFREREKMEETAEEDEDDGKRSLGAEPCKETSFKGTARETPTGTMLWLPPFRRDLIVWPASSFLIDKPASKNEKRSKDQRSKAMHSSFSSPGKRAQDMALQQKQQEVKLLGAPSPQNAQHMYDAKHRQLQLRRFPSLELPQLPTRLPGMFASQRQPQLPLLELKRPRERFEEALAADLSSTAVIEATRQLASANISSASVTKTAVVAVRQNSEFAAMQWQLPQFQASPQEQLRQRLPAWFQLVDDQPRKVQRPPAELKDHFQLQQKALVPVRDQLQMREPKNTMLALREEIQMEGLQLKLLPWRPDETARSQEQIFRLKGGTKEQTLQEERGKSGDRQLQLSSLKYPLHRPSQFAVAEPHAEWWFREKKEHQDGRAEDIQSSATVDALAWAVALGKNAELLVASAGDWATKASMQTASKAKKARRRAEEAQRHAVRKAQAAQQRARKQLQKARHKAESMAEKARLKATWHLEKARKAAEEEANKARKFAAKQASKLVKGFFS
eukprot:TRINITY_DN20626_c0_g1_i1.p1 TRINITY_DN20626_c0_g1~~TRINITY_DN20626_c0_g1_i1.p1  ORF type:complete len:896 (-),score=255.62 TRINITY_DN20626_c0_g1_i1:116-2623(-)